MQFAAVALNTDDLYLLLLLLVDKFDCDHLTPPQPNHLRTQNTTNNPQQLAPSHTHKRHPFLPYTLPALRTLPTFTHFTQVFGPRAWPNVRTAFRYLALSSEAQGQQPRVLRLGIAMAPVANPEHEARLHELLPSCIDLAG